MSDDKNKNTPLSMSGRKTLQMKPTGAPGAGSGTSGVVVQRKKKLIMPGQSPATETDVAKPKSIIKTPFGAEKKPSVSKKTAEVRPSAGGLSVTEREKRAKVLEKAQKDGEEKAKRAAEEAKRKAVEDAAQAERRAKEAAKNKKVTMTPAE